ncbi:GH116 family glycosyl hydrolase [Paenibacillus herberti]|uniref:Glycosyl-hydrolase family 116 catalytic region domain-containing protein n=1 Tax=Paenibacillus herberti TaxID=1619309 RepID=A0A229P2P8_9BACL|nr:GH116 family glycosyl hydrolase [Paenibacillus herberti]OXM16388.1 hypothetical protein CGZ75_06845 [Paenibacillus herberti]
METIINKKMQRNGMALGGIGSGTVEINQNGVLKDWHIFNLGQWASREAKKYKLENLYDYDTNVMPFYIRTKQGTDMPKFRKLSHDLDGGEFRSMMYSWHKEVKEIHYEASFPISELNYLDESLPVKIRSEFTSPFVPLDSRVSGTPGFYATFSIENTSDENVEVSLLGKLKNPINRGLSNRELKNRLHKSDDRVSVTMSSDSNDSHQQNGSISFSVGGGDNSYIQGDFSSYFANFVLEGEFGVTEQSYLFDFRETGRLPNLGTETFPGHIAQITDDELQQLNDLQINELMSQILEIASSNPPYQRILEIDQALLADRAGKIKFIRVIREQMNSILKDAEGHEAWGDAALCSSVTLKPGEKKDIQFIVSWYFPNHFSDQGGFVGHMYTNWFKDAKEVNDYLSANSNDILNKVKRFANEVVASDTHPSFVNNWTNQLNTVIKSSWWSKQGDFSIWEGYGSCGFHTMDITYQGSFNLLALFPDLQLGQMELGAKFQREDGRVHHFFTPDFCSVDNGFDRVDMNPQYVLLVCRDYLWTGNIDYVRRLWDSIVLAMDSIEKIDQDGDCLPDTETASNTYDAWQFKGTPSYISSLWLAALLAASRLAEDLGEEQLKIKWQNMLEIGKKNFEQKLWNDEYFSLWVDGEVRDECCMADQIDGQWFAQLIGLGNFIPEELTQKALKAVFNHNYHTETGLINAVYPKHAKPTLYTHRNVQAEANWSGIEFAFVSALMEYGHVNEAIELSHNVDQRYIHAGRIFNHEECGDHYYRAMAGWSILLSASGFKLDVPKSTVTFVPPVESIQAPWFAPSGYGRFIKKSDTFELQCTVGEISFQTLVLNIKSIEQIQVNGENLSFKFIENADRTIIKFDGIISLKPDMKLVAFREAQ